MTVRASTGVRIQGLGFGFVVLTSHRQTLNFYVSFEIFQTGEELTSVIPFFLKVSDCLHEKCLHSVQDKEMFLEVPTRCRIELAALSLRPSLAGFE